MCCKKSVYCPKPVGPKDDESAKNNRPKDNASPYNDTHKNEGSPKNGGCKDHGSPKHVSEDGFRLTLFGKDFRLAKCFVTFFLKKVGKEYSRHAEIVKECKKRNDEIYRKVMVRTHSMMSPDWSI